MTKLYTPEFRVSFPDVFEPNSKFGDKYQLTMLFTKDADLSALKQAVKDAIKEKWGDTPKKLKLPFKNGDEEEFDGYENTIFLRTASKEQPGLATKDKNGAVNPILDRKEFYAGCYAIATVNVYAWEHDTGGKGVSFGLQNVCKTREGEPFSPRATVDNDFGDYDIDSALSDDDKDLLAGLD